VPEQMNVKFVRFGEMMVTASATDNSGETISLRLKFSVDSSFETILCIALYVVAIIIVIIILAVLYNKLVIHQDWKTVKKPGYSVMLDGFTQITISGADTSDFRVKGRNKCKLSTLAREFEIGDDGAGNATFAKIELWPTTGKNIVVELAPKAKIPANILIKVDGKELKKKAIWKRNGRIEITYPNNMTGFECVCTFVRH